MKRCLIIILTGIMITSVLFGCDAQKPSQAPAITIEDILDANGSLLQILQTKKQIYILQTGDAYMMGDTLQAIHEYFFFRDGKPVSTNCWEYEARQQKGCVWDDRSYWQEDDHLMTTVDLSQPQRSAWDVQDKKIAEMVSPYAQIADVRDEGNVWAVETVIPSEPKGRRDIYRVEKGSLCLTEAVTIWDGHEKRIRISYGEEVPINEYNLLDGFALPTRNATLIYGEQTLTLPLAQNAGLHAGMGEDVRLSLWLNEAKTVPYTFERADSGDFTVWAS